MKLLEVSNVTKKIGQTEILKGLSFSINEGEIYGLLGPNGAGKTTLMKILVQLSRPTSGKILYMNKDIRKLSHNMLRDVGNIIEYPSFYPNLTGKENLYMHCDYMNIDYSRVMEMLTLVSLEEKCNVPVKKFSLGMKQRLALARSLLHNPKFLVLDEPINGLDPLGIKEIREILIHLKESMNTTILISSHILSEIALMADRVGILSEGKLIGEMELKGKYGSKELEEYYISALLGGN